MGSSPDCGHKGGSTLLPGMTLYLLTFCFPSLELKDQTWFSMTMYDVQTSSMKTWFAEDGVDLVLSSSESFWDELECVLSPRPPYLTSVSDLVIAFLAEWSGVTNGKLCNVQKSHWYVYQVSTYIVSLVLIIIGRGTLVPFRLLGKIPNNTSLISSACATVL